MESKLKQRMGELDSLEQGKNTFKNMFKGKDAKTNRIQYLKTSIGQTEVGIEQTKDMIRIKQSYLGERAIPWFIHKQERQYREMLEGLSEEEV